MKHEHNSEKSVINMNFTFHFNRNSATIFKGDDCDVDVDDVSYLVGKLIFST